MSKNFFRFRLILSNVARKFAALLDFLKARFRFLPS